VSGPSGIMASPTAVAKASEPAVIERILFESYNAFVLLAVPFFLLAANLMNSAGITDRLAHLSQAMAGHLPDSTR
jgi:TRAP-type mannitol/chloroaromatic compound transport system permease large subunit